VDQTPVVACSQTHTQETLEVLHPAEQLTLALVKRLADSCVSPQALAYVDARTAGSSRIAIRWFFGRPRHNEPQAGVGALRCRRAGNDSLLYSAGVADPIPARRHRCRPRPIRAAP
jgi:hypothetical protein